MKANAWNICTLKFFVKCGASVFLFANMEVFAVNDQTSRTEAGKRQRKIKREREEQMKGHQLCSLFFVRVKIAITQWTNWIFHEPFSLVAI